MHLVLTGATGLIGSAVLQTMLTTPSVSQITILSRRPVAQAEGHSKARVIIHQDYTTYDAQVMEALKDADGVVWAQGISAMKVGKEEYEQITNAYPLAFARALAATKSPSRVTFVYVSSEGATTSPCVLSPHWTAVKGRTEADLLALARDPSCANLRPITLRSGGVDPGEHKEIHPYVPKLPWYFWGLLPPMRALMPGMVTPTRLLGRVLTDLAMGDGEPQVGEGVSGEGRTLGNAAVLRLARLRT